MSAAASRLVRRAAFACAMLISAGAGAQSFPMPAQADIVQAQANYAKVQLRVLASVYGADPSGAASKEAFEKGMAPAMPGWSSPVQGWPARGPNLGESVQPLMAMALAGQMGCKEVEGACQDKAMAAAGAVARKVAASKNPGRELAAQVSRLD